MAQPQTIKSEPLEAPRANRAHINEHLYALFAPEFVKDYPDGQIEIAYASPATDDDGPDRSKTSRYSRSRKRPTSRKGRTRPASMSTSAPHYGTANRAVGLSRKTSRPAPAPGRTSTRPEMTSGSAISCGKRTSHRRRSFSTGATPHRRFQIYVRLAGKVTAEQLVTANTALRDWLGGDDVQGMQSLMRLAGTINYPKPAKIGRGYIVEPVTLRTNSTAPGYTVEQLTGLAGKPSSGIDSSGGARPGRTDDEIDGAA